MFKSKLKFLLLCSYLCLLPNLIDSKIICDVETYVLSGIEFAKCHQGTMEAFPSTPLNMNPCPGLKHLVNSCSEVVKHCYDERGWIRGRQALLELLSLQFPEQNECDVFSNKDDPNLPQQLPDEKCSINEEVVLMQEMRTCSSEEQSTVLTNLLKTSNPSDTEAKFSEIICGGLKNVSEKCFVNKLTDCYTEEDSQYHLAFLLEELKLTGITLLSHLNTVATNGSTETPIADVVDLDSCPVFKNGPLSIFIAHQVTYEKTSDNKSVTILAVLLTVIVAFVMAVLGYFVFKTRLVPRLRAHFENTPYTDFVVQEQGQIENPEELNQPDGSRIREGPKPGNQTISMVVTNESTSSYVGPST